MLKKPEKIFFLIKGDMGNTVFSLFLFFWGSYKQIVVIHRTQVFCLNF